IRIDTTTLNGVGKIHANAVYMNAAGGGGGRVAVYYAGTLGVPKTNITAIGGRSDTVARQGAPGTVFFKRSDQTYGELWIDNGTLLTNRYTPLASIGSGTITAVTSSTGGAVDTIVDANAHFPTIPLLAGTRVFVNGDKSVLWKVVSNTATSLTLDVSSTPLTAQVGQTYSGLLRFDAIRLRNASLIAGDAVESLAPIDKDSASQTL